MAWLLDRVVVGILPVLPKPLVGYFSRRYIAGTTIAEAFETVRALRSLGAMSSLDILGENIEREEEADRAESGYRALLEAIAREKIDSGVSVKLTQLGLKLDVGGCQERIDRLTARAAELGIFVRIDMEDSTVTSDTLRVFRSLRARHENVGVVIQSMLRRSLADVEQLAAEKANIRLCKGIYVEPHDVAYRDREIIRRSFVELLDVLFSGGSYVGIATHDERLVFEALALIRRHRLRRDQYEFQMLLGVAEPLRRILIEAGHPLRVYVPFGEQWYAYSVRRLKENPQLAGTIARAALTRRKR
ncbi:MAG: proline dehydrogenase [Candidatus Eisenbacteria bacterium]|nr:proline dehydrogenase [Candidatus Latescibacterota bacterium]MBD3302048.1 proline dehydrogenase [Candidatus Eisenbacteria bacterium]